MSGGNDLFFSEDKDDALDYKKNHQKKVKEKRSDRKFRLLKHLRMLFKLFLFDFAEYNSASAPYAQSFLENLIKFYIGEEYMLGSDIIKNLQYNDNLEIINNKY